MPAQLRACRLIFKVSEVGIPEFQPEAHRVTQLIIDTRQHLLNPDQVDRRLQAPALLTQIAKRAIQGDIECLAWLEQHKLVDFALFTDGTKQFVWNPELHKCVVQSLDSGA